MKYFYHNEMITKDIKSVKMDIKTVSLLLEKYNENDSASKISLEDLDKITAKLFETTLTLLSFAEQTERDSGLFYEEGYRRICTENVPIKVDFDGRKLSVKTPLTIKRAASKSSKIAKENYLIQRLLSAKIEEYKERNPMIKDELLKVFSDKYLVFYIIRKGLMFSSNVYCDNDNLENKRIQNAICSLAGVSDRADRMDLYTCFRSCENETDIGTEFILVGYDHVPLLGL